MKCHLVSTDLHYGWLRLKNDQKQTMGVQTNHWIQMKLLKKCKNSYHLHDLMFFFSINPVLFKLKFTQDTSNTVYSKESRDEDAVYLGSVLLLIGIDSEATDVFFFFSNLHHSRSNPKSPFQTEVVPSRGHMITMASTSLHDIKLECEGCRVVFITPYEFLTFMTYRRVFSKK